MAGDGPEPKKHLILNNTSQSEEFRPPGGGGGGTVIPRRNRGSHGRALLQQLQTVSNAAERARAEQEALHLQSGDGLQIEFESFPNIELAFESLAAERSGIELLNVRDDNERTLATVFVPDGKLQILERKVSSYLDEARDTNSGRPANQRLVDAIQSIREASVRSLWTDDPIVFPQDDDPPFWWEVWLQFRGNREQEVGAFRELAEGCGFRLTAGQISFPERTIVMMFGSLEQMQNSIIRLSSIAELRRAKETADFFDALPVNEQADWIDELMNRVTMSEEVPVTPRVCLLDTGINDGHPVLAPSIDQADQHTVEPNWGVNDNDGHGTEMAGLALLGDLTTALSANTPQEVSHRLESVKLLNRRNTNTGDPDYHGYLTTEAVSRPEITAPDRRRVFSMAITAKDDRDRGRPSAWSATVDRLAVDYENMGETPRLFILSAGNVADPNAWLNYPFSNSSDGIHDPGQAWNAITVGASTELTRITEPDTEDYQPIAPSGALSPFSTTSLVWQPHWPIKPDVVFEGGNAASTTKFATPYAETKASLSLLTTNAQIQNRLFTTSNATSAASALASKMAATLMAEYPELRVETIRALIIHSADWTEAMKNQFLQNPANPNKADMLRLVRHCGYGQPDLSRALWSVENSLTLICEDSLQPFMRVGNNPPKLRDMNLHRLPWPLRELEDLGETQVEMRVTLSYFIEPNPSARGIKSRYRYESHGLRFEVKRQHESDAEFRSRINLVAREAEGGNNPGSGSDLNWMLGTKNRHRGSLHSDIWIGSAADLASRGMLAVYPVSGWWKTRAKLERFDKAANYTILVSIRAPESEVDLYTAIESQIATTVTV